LAPSRWTVRVALNNLVSLRSLRSFPVVPAIAWVVLGVTAVAPGLPAHAGVALMAGQRAKPLNGTFNRVPVLHSNQPEEVEGPGILISTVPGFSLCRRERHGLGKR
jgi:hypothetical protein